MSSRRAGFTLLEVLAAVALLAIAYATLGASGIQGLQQEGEARRRLQASLLADAVLAEVESEIERGAAPPVGRDEREEEGFRVEIAVEPYTLAVPEDDGAGGKRLGRARSRLGGDAATAPEPPPGPSLLGGGTGAARGGESPLRRITVEVAWEEGFGERSARRTTWALDAEAASETLASLAQAAAAGAAGGPGAQPNNPLGGADRAAPDGSAPPLQQGR